MWMDASLSNKKKKSNYTAYAAHFFLSLVLPSRSLTSYADRTDFTLLLLKQFFLKKKTGFSFRYLECMVAK